MIDASSSVAARLAKVVVLAVLAGILTSVSFFVLVDLREGVVAERARLQSATAAFAAAAAPAMRAGDDRGLLMVLRGIRAMPEFRYAAAVDETGKVVAEIGQTEMLVGRDGALEAMGLVGMLSAKSLSVSSDILDGGRKIGSLTLTASLSKLWEHRLRALQTAAIFAVGLILATSLTARMLIRRIMRPLGTLAGEIADIGRRSDLSRRLKRERDDEVGTLVEAFNEMFSQIAERDAALQRHRDSLEQTVEERTAQLSAAKLDAERANAAKSDFLATMSHEIRTPMNGMMVMAELLAGAPLPSRERRFAEIITRSGRGLLNIINDVLDFSKIESGHLSLERIAFSPSQVVEDTIQLFTERAREKGLSLAVHSSVRVPTLVLGDPTRFGQIATNLVNNALKFTETGGVLVRLDAVGEAGSEKLRLTVRDSGVGIAAADLPSIFTSFKQADQTITRRFGGTGLGLAITKRLAEAMGGEIEVESTPNLGSTFSFTVALPAEAPAAAGPRFDGRTVSIVSRDAILVEALRLALEEGGARIVAAGQKADLALVDERQGAAAPDAGMVVGLRGFGAASAASGGADGHLLLPVTRADIARLGTALETGSFGAGENGLETGRPADRRFASIRALAVDDNPVNREVLGETLASLGVKVDMAESGAEALRMAAGQDYDIIYMDCSMPDMDGFEATERLRAAEAQTGHRARVVALTAHVAGSDAGRWQLAGMDDYVGKPFTVADIAATLARVAGDETDGAEGATAETSGAIALIAEQSLRMFASISGGDALAKRVFALFEQHADLGYDQLAAAGADAVATRERAHALKSMAYSAGASRVGQICQTIETAASEGMAADERSLAALKVAIGETVARMRELAEDLEAPERISA